jgi:hypothetical protein
MAENLRSPGQANQVIVFENAPVSVHFATGYERKDKMLVSKANKLNEIARLGVSCCEIPGHDALFKT